jgi:hypothetical protein
LYRNKIKARLKMKGKSDCTSDVKVVDQDDKNDDELSENDEEEEVDEAEFYDQSIQTPVAGAIETGDTVDPALQEREHHYLVAARKERMDFLASEAKKIPPPASKQDRLDYLIAQSDVFAHFLAGKVHHVFAKSFFCHDFESVLHDCPRSFFLPKFHCLI